MWVSGNLFVCRLVDIEVECKMCRRKIYLLWTSDNNNVNCGFWEWVGGSLDGSLLNPLLILELISPPIISRGKDEQDKQLLSKDCSTGSYNLLWTQVKNGWAGQLKRRLCTIPWPSESIKFNLWTSKVHTCDKFYYPKAQSAHNPMASAICILCGGVECE